MARTTDKFFFAWYDKDVRDFLRNFLFIYLFLFFFNILHVCNSKLLTATKTIWGDHSSSWCYYINFRIQLNILLIVFQAPSYNTSLFCLQWAHRCHRYTGKGLLHIPSLYVKHSDRAFPVSAPSLVNQLLLDIKNCGPPPLVWRVGLKEIFILRPFQPTLFSFVAVRPLWVQHFGQW